MPNDLINDILNNRIENYTKQNELNNKRLCSLLNFTILDEKTNRKFKFL